jgi:hypothetical protein
MRGVDRKTADYPIFKMSQHPTIQAPLNNFIASIFTAGTSLVQAAIALFHLVLAFGHFWIDQFIQFAQTCIQLGFDLFRGVTGFIVGMSIKWERSFSRITDALFLAANFFILLVLGGGGGYYWWSTRTQRGKGGRRIKLRE